METLALVYQFMPLFLLSTIVNSAQMLTSYYNNQNPTVVVNEMFSLKKIIIILIKKLTELTIFNQPVINKKDGYTLILL